MTLNITAVCLFLLFAGGCRSTLTQDGTWVGYLSPVTLHDNDFAYTAVLLRIAGGTSLNGVDRGENVPPQGPVLIDEEARLLRPPNAHADQLISVTGTYYGETDLYGNSGALQWGEPPPDSPYDTMDMQFIKIKTIRDSAGKDIPMSYITPADEIKLIPFTTIPADTQPATQNSPAP